MKKIRLHLIISLVIVTILSCETEEIQNFQENQIEINRKHFLGYSNLTSLYNYAVTEQKNKLASGKNDLYDFEIDSSSVTQIKYNEDAYYTLRVNRKNSNEPVFENLIVSNKKSDNPNAYLLKYYPDDAFFARYTINENTYFSGSRSIRSLDYNKITTSRGGCFTVTTTYCNYENHEDNESGPGVAGPACTDTYTVTTTVCIDAGDSSSGGLGDYNYPTGGGNGSAGGGSGGQSNPNGLDELLTTDIITVPDAISLPEPDWSDDLVLFDDIPDEKISDLDAYFAPFDLSKPAVFTLYADQPKANSDDSWVDLDPSFLGTDPDVGHTFISIQQGSITRLIGFYPENGVYPRIRNTSVGVFRENSDHEYEVSITKPIDAIQLQKIISETKLFINNDYDLNTNNCTDYGLMAARKAGISIGSCYGTWPGGGGDNPGALGQRLRGLNLSPNMTRNTTGGRSPLNSN